ncbi:MAG: 23S rRNA (adenine(2503)-C(2))-methyltransferase RlmN [Lachnospiraceae bacterium]
MDRKDLKSMTLPELTAYIQEIGEPAFRARQLYGWMHQKLVSSYDEMSNLPKQLKTKLQEQADFVAIQAVQKWVSQIDGTTKYLFQLEDGHVIESVLMRYKHGNSVCISSQVGCRMGCRFCASTLGGLTRCLRPSEMLEQIYRIQADTGERVSNVVVMGTGEPFDNYENLMRFITLLTDENGLNISQRNITVSTCGLVERMKEFADAKLQVTLAISLHAPNDAMRKELMPVANKYTIAQIMEACHYYLERNNRRITFEYSLVAGVNDRPEHAKELIALLKGMLAHVNLIPVNPIKERDYVQPDMTAVTNFKNMLEKSNINVSIRREMGRDIQAACGQLRKDYIDTHKE